MRVRLDDGVARLVVREVVAPFGGYPLLPEQRRAVVDQYALIVLRPLRPGVHEFSSLFIADFGLVRLIGGTVVDGEKPAHVRTLVAFQRPASARHGPSSPR